jgi:TatD DNase family protein
MLIDIHCHISCLSLEEKEKISSLSGDYLFIDSSINYPSSLESIELSKNYKSVYSALGFHPFYAEEFEDSFREDYQKLIEENKKVVAIGEVGLDCKANLSLKEQEKILRIFLELAQEEDLPLIIHNREDNWQVLKILDEFFSSYEKIIFHCFSYSSSILKKIIEKKGYISFSLNVLRKKEEIISSLKNCPLDNLLLETDSPYMKIGNRNSFPWDIKELYYFVADLKGIDKKELEEKIFYNTKRLFKFC